VKDSLPVRRLIPRWRSISNTLELPEASFGRGRRSDELIFDAGRFQNAVTQWRRFKTTGHLGDVLGFSIAPSFRDSLQVVAREAMANPQNVTEPQMAILRSFLEDAEVSEFVPAREDNDNVCNRAIQENVRLLRNLLLVSPANPLVLLDFAQLQLSVGKTRKAERVLLTALSLSPNNRVILRTLARFYVHTGRFDEAHRLISRHARTATDPWLMAAEISLAGPAESSSKFIALGRRFIVDKAAGIADLSELAGAIGGEELGSGNVKRARDLFRIALLAPNDNVVAQVITDHRSLSMDLSQPTQRNVVREASEARTLLAWNSLNTGAAETAALIWHEEEPFSSRPLQFLTTLYAIENRLDWTENLSRRGLIANPSDPSLMANLGYALAGQGKLEEAEAIERKLASKGDSHFVAVATATRGLIAMKRGLHDIADHNYNDAYEKFGKLKRPSAQVLCLAYYARSAMNAGHPNAEALLRKALDAYRAAPSSDAAILLRQLSTEIEAPKTDEKMRRLEQWVYDPTSNTLTKKQGVSELGAPLLIRKDAPATPEKGNLK
jgi:Flp pilus assembly protein TadD